MHDVLQSGLRLARKDRRHDVTAQIHGVAIVLFYAYAVGATFKCSQIWTTKQRVALRYPALSVVLFPKLSQIDGASAAHTSANECVCDLHKHASTPVLCANRISYAEACMPHVLLYRLRRSRVTRMLLTSKALQSLP